MKSLCKKFSGGENQLKLLKKVKMNYIKLLLNLSLTVEDLEFYLKKIDKRQNYLSVIFRKVKDTKINSQNQKFFAYQEMTVSKDIK